MRCRHSSQTHNFTSLQWIQLTGEGSILYHIVFYSFIYPSERHQRQHEALLQRVCSLEDEWIQANQQQVLLKKWSIKGTQIMDFPASTTYFILSCEMSSQRESESTQPTIVQISCNKFRPVMPAGDHLSKKNIENKAIMYIQH